MGSVRTLRDYVEGNTLHDIFNAFPGGYGEDEVWLMRRWLNGSTVQYLGFFAADNNTRLEPRPSDEGLLPSINITRVDKSKNATVRFESTFNFTSTTPLTPHVPLRGLGMDELFGKEGSGEVTNSTESEGSASNTSDILKAIRGPGRDIVDQLAFLAYESEFLAGGWRFLTCKLESICSANPDFGRDTLLAMQVLLPVLSPEACEAILAGVIQRTNATSGELCHEETVSLGVHAIQLTPDWRLRLVPQYAFKPISLTKDIQAGHPERGNTPEYDYKMVDTDFLLLSALADYAKRYPARARQLMARNSTLVPGSLGSLLRTNADHVLALAAPFAASPVRENLIAFRAWPLGNWRDSAAGNGWGTYSFDVNCESG